MDAERNDDKGKKPAKRVYNKEKKRIYNKTARDKEKALKNRLRLLDAGHSSTVITSGDTTPLLGTIVGIKAELEWYKQQLNTEKAVSAANLAFGEEALRKLAEANLLIAAKDEKLARFEDSNFSFSLNDTDGLGWLLDDDTGLGIQSTCATSGEGLYSHNIANKGALENLGVAAIKANSRDVDCGKYLEYFRAFGDFVKGIEPLKAYHIPLDEDIFGANVEVPLQRVDMEHISEMQQLSVSCIMLYMSHLYRVMKSGNFGRKFFFVNPSAISGVTEELVGGSKSALLANLLEGVQNGQLAFVPYNLGLHWILLVICLSSATVYYLDSLYLGIVDKDMKFIVNSAIEIYDSRKGNIRSPTWKRVKCPQQSTTFECGFYVMRFMKELIADQSILNEGDFNGRVAYTKDEIDEVRFDWMKLVEGLDICGKVGHREEDAVNIGDEVVQHATMGSFIEPTDGTS